MSTQHQIDFEHFPFESDFSHYVIAIFAPSLSVRILSLFVIAMLRRTAIVSGRHSSSTIEAAAAATTHQRSIEHVRWNKKKWIWFRKMSFTCRSFIYAPSFDLRPPSTAGADCANVPSVWFMLFITFHLAWNGFLIKLSQFCAVERILALNRMVRCECLYIAWCNRWH